VTVALRRLVPADAAVLAGWGRDPAYVAAADWTPRTYDGYLEFWSSRIDHPPDRLVRLAAVVGDDLVGYADLFGEGPTSRELGYAVGPRASWGLGYGTQIARLMTAYGFDELGLAEVTAEALDANAASVRILERVGMTESARGDDATFVGRPTFYRRFAITRATRR
jgi:RimJ/RimL family protein N-acetyltransferase